MRGLCSTRMVFALMSFLGITGMYMMRINLSTAIIVMTRKSQKPIASQDSNHSTFVCPDSAVSRGGNESSDTEIEEGEFDWTSHTQELLLASFFIGYAITQMPGGWLADRFGGKWIMAIGVVTSAIMNLIGPLAARKSAAMFFVTRCLAGGLEGVTLPAVNSMVSKWSPDNEKSRMMSFIVAGMAFGATLGQILSGLIIFYLGWAASFYIFGYLCVVWSLLWAVVIYDEPSVHPWILIEERRYIENKRSLRSSHQTKYTRTPLRAMVTALPAIAFHMTLFTIPGYVFLTLVTNLPMFMKHVLHFDIMKVGFLSSAPYISQWVVSLVASSIADFLIGRKIFSITFTRKLMIDIGAIIISGSLICVSQVDCSPNIAVAMVTLAAAGMGIVFSSIFVNTVDLAPRFSGTLMGIGNSIAVTSGFIAPVVAGLFTENQADPSGWRSVFYIVAGVCLFGAIFFQLFGSGEVQDWAKCKTGPRRPTETESEGV